MRPAIACLPPTPMTRTMPILTQTVSAGERVDMNRMARTELPGQVLVGRAEAHALVIGPDEGLDQAGAGDVLLQDGVEPVQLLLDGPEQGLHLEDEEDQDGRRHGQKRQHGQGQARACPDHQDQAPDH